MHKDGISGVAVTVSLILNLTMYNLAIMTLGILSLIFFPGIFMEFELPCKILILIGIVMITYRLFHYFIEKTEFDFENRQCDYFYYTASSL